SAHLGRSVLTVTGRANPQDHLTRTTHVSLVVRDEASSPIQVDLSSAFLRTGVTTDGRTFGGGIDGGGAAYSANLLGPSLTFDGTLFTFGPADQPNVVAAGNQVIPLPSGRFGSLQMLATGINGGQGPAPVIVNYSDGTSDTLMQGFSDW